MCSSFRCFSINLAVNVFTLKWRMCIIYVNTHISRDLEVHILQVQDHSLSHSGKSVFYFVKGRDAPVPVPVSVQFNAYTLVLINLFQYYCGGWCKKASPWTWTTGTMCVLCLMSASMQSSTCKAFSRFSHYQSHRRCIWYASHMGHSKKALFTLGQWQTLLSVLCIGEHSNGSICTDSCLDWQKEVSVYP